MSDPFGCSLTTAVAAVGFGANEGTLISDTKYELLSIYCLNCHDEVEMKGEGTLDPNPY